MTGRKVVQWNCHDNPLSHFVPFSITAFVFPPSPHHTLLLFKSAFSIFRFSSPPLSFHLGKFHPSLWLASSPPPHFSTIIYPRLARQSIWPLAPWIKTMYSGPNPDSMSTRYPHLTPSGLSPICTLNQTASELQPVRVGGDWLCILTASGRCNCNCSHTRAGHRKDTHAHVWRPPEGVHSQAFESALVSS